MAHGASWAVCSRSKTSGRRRSPASPKRRMPGRWSAKAASSAASRHCARRRRRSSAATSTYRQIFYVADVEASGPPLDGELHVDLDEADFLAVFPLAGTGRARLIGTVRDERAEHPEALQFGMSAAALSTTSRCVLKRSIGSRPTASI